MKKILSLICAVLILSLPVCGQGEAAQHDFGGASISSVEESAGAWAGGAEVDEMMLQIQVTANGKDIVFELNDCQAARDLCAQLPLSVEVADYSTNEKIFYPPQALDISDAPQANAVAGTLAYYAPWDDVVMFYGDFGSASGLYILGQAVSGGEFIEEMTGLIEISQLQG